MFRILISNWKYWKNNLFGYNEQTILQATMDLSRIELNEDILERHYEYKKSKANNALKDCANYVKKYYRPNRQNVARFVADLFYFLKWLPKYKFKEYFPRDFLGGLTLGVVLIPQTIGYSLMGVRNLTPGQ